MTQASPIHALQEAYKHPRESILYAFDFAPLLASGETLSGSPTVSVETGLTKSGAAAIDGATVEQRITGGTAGTDYVVECECATSGSNTFVITGTIKVRDDAAAATPA